ncbi:MAG: hypothetical protein RSG22_02840 [Comamonas sp.]
MADIDGKLVFTALADGSGRLVFGVEGDSGAAPGAELGVEGDFPEMDGAITLVIAYEMAVDGDLPGMEGDVGLQYDSGVFRGTRVGLEFSWQEAGPVEARLDTAWQVSEAHAARLAARWREAIPLAARVGAVWQETERLQSRLATSWQNAVPLSTRLALAWQETIRLESRLAMDWQEAVPLSTRLALAWQETLHLSVLMDARWQQAIPTRTELRTSFGNGRLVARRLDARWQEATWPRSGVSLPPVVIPPEKELCYDPATVARLVFSEARDGTGKLVFVCLQKGTELPPALVVVPSLRTYIMFNEIEVRRADSLSGDPLPCQGINMQLDRSSWTWSFSAEFHHSVGDAVTPGANGEPVELDVRVNGTHFRLQSEKKGWRNAFPERVVKISGRGKSALLAAPHAPETTYTNALAASAQQLMLDALTINNGASLGWQLDWQLTDWIVPAGVWMHQGTSMSAVAEIASAVGGYIQPHNTEKMLRVLPTWPKAWWDWDQLTPDFELQPGAFEVVDSEWTYKPAYNRVFVSGENQGHFGDYSIRGTAGDLLKPMVTHPLLTSIDAVMQRASHELSDTGMLITDQLTMPVLPQTGLIVPGKVLRYLDDSNVWRLGIVDSVNLQYQFPVLTQALGVRSHA